MTEVDWKAASISGHRSIGPNSKRRVWYAVQLLVENSSIKEIYFGGARGTDTEALKAALYYRSGKHPRLVVVLPDTLNQQPRDTREWTVRSDEVIELKIPLTPEDGFASYKKRNEYIVDHGTILVAFFNGNFKSGTGHQIRRETRKLIYKINVSST